MEDSGLVDLVALVTGPGVAELETVGQEIADRASVENQVRTAVEIASLSVAEAAVAAVVAALIAGQEPVAVPDSLSHHYNQEGYFLGLVLASPAVHLPAVIGLIVIGLVELE